ncbi:hypothetical protein DFR62_2454 [Planococcus citreus]|uniref:Uncharacterized protein n=1 Tax=Planococcus citreus TaxID=1373 RepID=A0A497YQD2_9BACL|nr:hypothetical protein DFR62_2454 [Planococcus citreus]
MHDFGFLIIAKDKGTLGPSHFCNNPLGTVQLKSNFHISA